MSEAQVEVQSAAHQRNQARVAKDEAELEALLKKARGESDDAEEEASQEEQATEAKPNSSEPVSEPVQTESRTEQKEERKAETQEDSGELSAEEKNFKKRYGDLRRHVQEKEQEWKVKFEQLQSQLDKATKNELVLPKSEKDIEAWAKKYPDVAGIVEAIADRKASERSSDIDKRLKEIEELRVDAKRQRAEAELLQMHPDFEQLRADDEFHSWADDQPKWVQDALYENAEDAKAVGRVIDLYKVDKGIKTTAKSASDKSAASSVRTRSSTQPTSNDSSNYLRESEVAKMSIREYEKRQEEILDAQRSGKFIYDVTRK